MQDFVLRYGETLMIGDIEVMVVRVQDDRVRLGIVAPAEVPVHRREVYLQLLRQNWPQAPGTPPPPRPAGTAGQTGPSKESP